MKHPHSFLIVSLLLLCCTQTITFAQSTASLTIPESLRGYWQFKTDNVSDWNGPLIGENFVENFYTVFYVEQMEQASPRPYGTAYSDHIARHPLSEMGERTHRKSNLRIHPGRQNAL